METKLTEEQIKKYFESCIQQLNSYVRRYKQFDKYEFVNQIKIITDKYTKSLYGKTYTEQMPEITRKIAQLEVELRDILKDFNHFHEVMNSSDFMLQSLITLCTDGIKICDKLISLDPVNVKFYKEQKQNIIQMTKNLMKFE